MAKNVVHFDTERKAEIAKRKFKKYKPTKCYRWTVQGNSLVRIAKRNVRC